MTYKKLLPWLLGIILATLVFGALFAYTDFQYLGSDDTPILRSFMGYEGGVPAHYNIILHTALAWLLHGLAVLFPGVAWFSILQLFLLWLSCVVIIKSMAQCAQNHRLPLFPGALMGSAFVAAFAAFILCRISFTTTGALVGAAAVAQLMAVDYAKGTNGQILRGMGLSIFLLLCCYSLRQIGVLPHLALWLLALLTIWFLYFAPSPKTTSKNAPAAFPSRSAKPLFTGVLICALTFGLFAGVRAIEIKTLQLDDYLSWQNARSNLFDYTNFGTNTDPSVLEEIGWSQAEFTLVTYWYFMDENITTEAFETLYQAQQEAVDLSLSAKLDRTFTTVSNFFSGNPIYRYGCFLLLLLCLANIFLSFYMGKTGRLLLALAALCGLLLGALMLGYLAWNGRLPMRAAVSAIFPAAIFQFGLFFACAAPKPTGEAAAKSKWVPIPALLSVLLCLGLAVPGSVETANALAPVPLTPMEEINATLPEDMDAYALENPDVLIIYDISLVADNRLFPDTSNGIPGNLMFWGGYPARSPSWLFQLSEYGIDGTAFTAQDFLRENVVVASSDGQPWESLLTYVAEQTAVEVDWDYEGENGYVGFFRLYEY